MEDAVGNNVEPQSNQARLSRFRFHTSSIIQIQVPHIYQSVIFQTSGCCFSLFLSLLVACTESWLLAYSRSQNKVPIYSTMYHLNGNSFSCVFSVHTTDKLNMCSVISTS